MYLINVHVVSSFLFAPLVTNTFKLPTTNYSQTEYFHAEKTEPGIMNIMEIMDS